MKYTNRMNFPKYIFDWLSADNYDHSKDDHAFSATTLLKPVKVHWLTARYLDGIESDVTERLSSCLGNAIHDSLEKVKTEGVSKEQRLKRSLKINNIDLTVVGKYDVLVHEKERWTLRDIKTTSVWAYIYGGKDDEYSKQLSIYRWLLQDICSVDSVAFIDFFFTDWQSSKAKTDPSYPQYRLIPGYKIDLMTFQQTEEYLKTRLFLFEKYRNVPDLQLPDCTLAELWATKEVFAVKKPDNQRATKLCDTQKEAEQYIANNKLKAIVERRAPRAKRCSYCGANNFCKQYATLVQQGLIESF